METHSGAVVCDKSTAAAVELVEIWFISKSSPQNLLDEFALIYEEGLADFEPRPFDCLVKALLTCFKEFIV